MNEDSEGEKSKEAGENEIEEQEQEEVGSIGTEEEESEETLSEVEQGGTSEEQETAKRFPTTPSAFWSSRV